MGGAVRRGADPHLDHSTVQGELYRLLKPVAGRLDVHASGTFNLWHPGDFRIPDAGLVPGPAGVWHETAVLAADWPSQEGQAGPGA